MEEYKAVLQKYFVFSGRASLREYWMFVLVNILISIGIAIISNILGLTADGGAGILSNIYSLAVMIPSIAVGVRRLHDTNRSGWWTLIVLVPIIGFIVLIVFTASQGTPGDNKYGPNPKGKTA